ncbi:MAG: metallophosphoesterase [Gammaproteobacteria bacterium]
MRIQYFSDIHLEFGAAALPSANAEVVVAAGDIDVCAAGVEWLRQSGLPTVYVCGNHEFYGGELGAVQDAIRAATVGSNVHFLDCESVVIAGVRFLGATLWTDFAGADEHAMRVLGARMNDYLQIRSGLRLLTPRDVLAFHRRARNWLATELARPHAGPTVVVTHHAPLLTSWHEEPDSPLRGAYCNDLAALLETHPVDTWIHGHVHAVCDYHHGDVRVLCNPRGYHGFREVEAYDGARVIEV